MNKSFNELGFKVGDKVEVPYSTNSVWYGVGSVTRVHPEYHYQNVCVRMESGECEGLIGAFPEDKLRKLQASEIKEETTKETTTMKLPFSVTDTTVTVFFEGKMWTLTSSDFNYKSVREHLMGASHDYDTIEGLLDKKSAIKRLSEGSVSVVGDTVYYRSEPVRDSLAIHLVNMLNEGFDVTPWAKFMDNIHQNPNEDSKASLYNFIDHFNTPITSDGCFLAFKRVRNDFYDLHSGRYDNSPGKIVEMPREEVDTDSTRTCSYGLHACASSYLGSFYANSPDARVVVVKINPKDVCAVPTDYSFSKMRVARYEVIGEAEESTITELDNTTYSTFGEPEYEDLLDDYDLGWDDDDYFYDSYDDSYSSY